MRGQLLLIPLLFSFSGFSQVQITEKKTVYLIEPKEVYINSATHVNGKTRICYQINLPKNTVEWYYMFTTNPNTDKSGLRLFRQIADRLLANPLVSIAATALSVDDGTSPLDVFLMDNKGYNEFNEKDIFGSYKYSRPSHFTEGTSLNGRQGKEKISNPTKGIYYLGLRNPSLNTSIAVKIEVVAIVGEISIDRSKWSKESKELLHEKLLTELKNAKYNEEKIQGYAVCLMEKMTKQYSPKDFSEMANYEVMEILRRYIGECNP